MIALAITLAVTLQSPKAAEFSSAPAMVRVPMPMAAVVPVDMVGAIGWTWPGVTNATGYTFAYNAVGGPTNFIAAGNTVLWITNNWDQPQYKFQVNATNATATSEYSKLVFIPPLPPTEVVLSWEGEGAVIYTSTRVVRTARGTALANGTVLTNAPGASVVLSLLPGNRFFGADKPITIIKQ